MNSIVGTYHFPKLVVLANAYRPIATVKTTTILTNSYATKTSVTGQKKSSSGTASKSGGSINVGANVDPPPTVFRTTDMKDVGPGAGKDKDYKNPEYFCYHKMSYADMDIVMMKARLPQPSSVQGQK